MDEIGQRLKECADACISAYGKWMTAKKDVTALENLQEAVHELRKVSARLEIEMAISEREEMSGRPIPVPPHRAAKRRDSGGNDLPDFITEGGEGGEGGNRPPRSQGGGGVRRMGGRRPPQQSQGESAGE
ncbi:MAG TPA: hypothetical protein PKI93_03420 [Alphaproteobacteria bacterium]|nr:hypothetical protein [Alphaproteobacteria bacterium]HNS44561.1 hypothetical protein [Alphaproteobacteria bacterium]